MMSTTSHCFFLRRAKIICLLIFLGHFVVSHIVLPALGRVDLYPFYSWDLFSFTPAVSDQYFILVHKINEKKIEPPDMVFRKREIYPGRNLFLVPHQIKRLGISLATNADQRAALSYRTEMEQNLFSRSYSVVYEVAVAKVDIRALLKFGEIASFNSLGRFEFHGKPEVP